MNIDYDNLKARLQNDVAIVTFKKKDGTERVMRCTLNEEALPESEDTTQARHYKATNKDAISVYDLEKLDWRAFRLDSVTNIEYLNLNLPIINKS